MPKVKEETVKEYVVAKLDLTKTKVDVDPSTMGVFLNIANNTIYVNPNYVSYLISEGIIAEKKSKAEEVTDKIIYRLEEDNQAVFLKKAEQAKQIILQELEKAQTKPAWSSVKPDFPCLFVARIKSKWGTSNMIFSIENRDGYLQLIDNDGMEDDSLENLQADEYIIIERH